MGLLYTRSPARKIVQHCPPTCSSVLTPKSVNVELLQYAWPSPKTLWPSLAASSPDLSPSSRLVVAPPHHGGERESLLPAALCCFPWQVGHGILRVQAVGGEGLKDCYGLSALPSQHGVVPPPQGAFPSFTPSLEQRPS